MTAYEKLVAENAVLKDRLQREATKRAMALLMTRKLITARQKIDIFLEQVCKHAIVEPGSERSIGLLRSALLLLARPLSTEIPASCEPNSSTPSTSSSSTAPDAEPTSTPPKSPTPSSDG